ncbi:PocR ligand-binding domain-containing protein [Desulfovibrio aminophilus]|uniref:PocR ligand-binding domain-containing protein n=1 Tax=Desulfovibrio aminophilus TaxID=81425 RepID=UPI0003FE70A2|nr:PocR ligand-binding domain-containing protein [Desulfovibrio aminophilus]
MKMTDLATREEWAALEREFHERFGMNPRVYDETGAGITDERLWSNPLCPALRATPGGVGAVCSVANAALTAQAAREGRTVIDACDAGLVVITVPVIVDGALIGIVGGCGRLPADGEVESFLVSKASGLGEDEVEGLATRVPVMSRADVEAAAAFLEGKVADILARAGAAV